MEYSDNVTLRKPKSASVDNLTNVSNSSILDLTMMSLPNTSLENTAEHSIQLQKLTSDLLSANIEIDNLNLENNRLKAELEKCQKIIDIYKKIGSRVPATPSSDRKKKQPVIKNSTPDYNVGSYL